MLAADSKGQRPETSLRRQPRPRGDSAITVGVVFVQMCVFFVVFFCSHLLLGSVWSQ